MTVKGKTVLITGSTDGVGRYVAGRLAADGARVIIHGRDRARGEAVVQQITKEGGDARLLVADLSSLAEVRSLAEAVQRNWTVWTSSSTMPGSARAGRGANSAPTGSNSGSRSTILRDFF